VGRNELPPLKSCREEGFSEGFHFHPCKEKVSLGTEKRKEMGTDIMISKGREERLLQKKETC